MDRSSIRACAGSAAAVRLADEIASTLEHKEGEPFGRRVVAIDGCTSACARRTLEARGLRPLTVTLDEFGVMPDEDVRGRARATLSTKVLARLEAQATVSTRPSRRRRRNPRPSVQGSAKRAHTANDYLYAIHLLTSPVATCGAVVADSPTVAAHVAEALSVTRATAGEMLARLEAGGFVARGPAKEILLTKKGRLTAGQLVHRHRLVERFLVDILDYSAAESYLLALEIRDAFPEIVADRLELLTRSSHCPHGWPVDPADDQDFAADLVALSTLPAGAKTTVVALIEHDAAMLERLLGQGLAPGVNLAVIGYRQGRLEVEVDGARLQLEGDEAASALVARDAVSQAGTMILDTH